jgi:single-strand DNA-binding protein
MTTSLTISGHLAADPELRFVPSGVAVAKFVVMSNERHRDRDTGAWTDGTRTDVRVTAWDILAENTAESLRKGAAVTVTGHRVEAHPWTAQDDTLRASLELTADDVQVSLRRHTVTTQKSRRTTTDTDSQDSAETTEAAG